jgi:hypothetical protein
LSEACLIRFLIIQQFRKRDPSSADETEFMENVFDILCSSLIEPETKHLFLQEEGVDLMVIIMKFVFQLSAAIHRSHVVTGRKSNPAHGPLKC